MNSVRKFALLFVLLIAVNSTAQIWVVDPLEPIYPDKNTIEHFSNKWKVESPLGAVVDAHVLVRLPNNTSFELEVWKGKQKIDSKHSSRLIDVPVEQNTGIDSRTEQFLGKINPYVIRRAPFRIFEVIEPLESATIRVTTAYTAFRLVLDETVLGVSGTHKFTIKVITQSSTLKGQLTVNVSPVALPKMTESDFFYTNWFNLRQMEEKHGVERWSEPWFVMLNNYAALMAHGRQNSITIPHELITYDGEEFHLDEKKMLKFIDVFRAHDFKYFEAPHLLNRGPEDDWGDPELKVALTKRRYYKENGKEDIDKIIHLIKNFTTKNALENSWLQHISDEPTAVNAACYKDVAKQIKSIYPEIKIMEATNARDHLSGSIDIWCPIIDDFQENESFFRSREAEGERVLVYTCLVPGGPWLNRTLDMEHLRQVYFGWGAAHYETGGYLHWGLNQYHGNPFEQSVVKHPSPVASANNYLPAGDTHVIYPGEQGPLSSVRFEAHRTGVEDYDLLQQLKRVNQKRYKNLLTKVFRSYTDYSTDIEQYRRTKKKLLRALQ